MPIVTFSGVDDHGNDKAVGKLEWDGHHWHTGGADWLRNVLDKPIVGLVNGRTVKIDAKEQPEAFLQALRANYKSAYLRASEPH